MFKRDSHLLENWLDVRQKILKDDKLGENIPQVEELIRKHDDFEKTIVAQEERFATIKRMTLLEQAFVRQREQEARDRRAERERQEQEKLQQRKRMEIQRITEQRRQEEYRDRTEERVNGGHYPKESDSVSPLPSPPVSSLTKSNSVAHMFDRDRFRRGSDSSVKRAESMKVGPTKPAKRTPSFTTRRRGSFRNRGAGRQLNLLHLNPFATENDQRSIKFPCPSDGSCDLCCWCEGVLWHG